MNRDAASADARHAMPLALILATSALLNFTSLLGAEMLGLRMYSGVAIQNIAFFLIARGSGLAFAYWGRGLVGLALGWLFGALSCLALSISLTWRKLPKPLHPPSKLYGEILAYSYPIWILAIITLAQGWVDVSILYALTGETAATAAYYLAVSGASLLAIFWGAISMAIFPAISTEEARVGMNALRPIFRTASRLLNLSILPLGAGLAAISRTAISIAYGPAYATSATPFAILTATAILPAYLAINTSALQAIAETKALAKAGATSAFVEIAMVSILAKPFGANGAVLARVAMYATALLLTQRVLTMKAGIGIDQSHFAKAGPFCEIACVEAVDIRCREQNARNHSSSKTSPKHAICF